ncbi:MAG: hypothetical protein OQK76_02900 [Gammaproteobacteria bacterium]|nr:hypothetical protein [Gammaproteobacteria bacterium]MCW8909549.1 hypothetical protein [Gammaproteobacteria bacterium]MCW9003975.1 hypothetical protein [Gammaproteobacteria bacterium]MCW9055683.1 hypothetical protein [Gammaproteobacteria bacterium]
MNEDNISKAVEAICHQGCTSVSDIIDALENGITVEQTTHLSCDELIALLKELKAIMAIYEKRN